MSQNEKLARLKRMRLVALAVLLVMLIAYAVSSLWQHSFPALPWLRAFAGAGVAGASRTGTRLSLSGHRPSSLARERQRSALLRRSIFAYSLGDCSPSTLCRPPGLLSGRPQCARKRSSAERGG
jgi:hypothetical protein